VHLSQIIVHLERFIKISPVANRIGRRKRERERVRERGGGGKEKPLVKNLFVLAGKYIQPYFTRSRGRNIFLSFFLLAASYDPETDP